MKKTIVLLIALVFLFTSCVAGNADTDFESDSLPAAEPTEEPTEPTSDTTETTAPPVDVAALVASIEIGMAYTEVMDILGEYEDYFRLAGNV